MKIKLTIDLYQTIHALKGKKKKKTPTCETGLTAIVKSSFNFGLFTEEARTNLCAYKVKIQNDVTYII